MHKLTDCAHNWRRALVLIAVLTACGGDDGVTPDPSLEFLVGDWEAIRFEVRPDASPSESVDLVGDLDGRFTLNVQPSGQYTAALTLPGLVPSPEIGVLSVEGSELVFNRTTPPPPAESRATFTQPASGRIIFTGPSSFDLDGDGSAEPITLEVEIVRD